MTAKMTIDVKRNVMTAHVIVDAKSTVMTAQMSLVKAKTEAGEMTATMTKNMERKLEIAADVTAAQMTIKRKRKRNMTVHVMTAVNGNVNRSLVKRLKA